MVKKKASINSYTTLVKDYYPAAKCRLRPNGKEYYQIIDDTQPKSILGQGKTKIAAWKSAYRNTYG